MGGADWWDIVMGGVNGGRASEQSYGWSWIVCGASRASFINSVKHHRTVSSVI